MIFYGSKGVHLHTEQVSGVKCSHCEQTSSHTVSIYGKYAHIYWIPFFPLGKKGISECNHCKATFEPKEMSESLKLAHKNVKGNVKTPIWHWSGIGIIAVVIGISGFLSAQHDKDVVTYIDKPKVGDVYEFKPNEYYSLAKVTSVDQDSVYVISNDYETEKHSDLNTIDKASNYTTEPYGISRKKIKELFKSKEILDVNRD